LKLSTSYNVRNLRTGALDSFKAQGLEIGAARGGGPTLHLNGRSLARSDRELALTGSTSNTVLIVLGVTLAAVTALVLITSDRAELPGPIV
jgi:LPXTG-motif cell wall-anchored protein